MSELSRPLIIGAGPVGLAASLLIERSHIPFRLIDASLTRAPFSRALALNPRTLEIFESLDLTEIFLRRGIPMQSLLVRDENNELVGKLDFASIHGKYPFMLALSQSVTEQILEEALEARGVVVERGVQLVHCEAKTKQGVRAILKLTHDGMVSLNCPWLFAADGAHSQVRKSLGMKQTGSRPSQSWNLIDVPLETDLEETSAHLFIQRKGQFLFLIRVVKDQAQEKKSPKLWRVIGNSPDLEDRLTLARAVGKPVWKSQFYIPHRICRRMSQGNVYFAGDAAHVHSPVGARGMNLGIEDAWVFAELLAARRLREYHHLRKAVDSKVVRRVERLSRIAMGGGFLLDQARKHLLPFALRVPVLHDRFLAFLTGLDHPVEGLA